MKTEEKIKIMQAWEDGKTIQYAYKSPVGTEAWHTLGETPMWNWQNFNYRIKPEGPMELWVNIYPGGIKCTYDTKEKAKRNFDDSPNINGRKAVHFREVIDENS